MMAASYDLDKYFPRYTAFHPQVPVWCVTPKTPRTIHRFFDTSPFSPSGRYMALTQLPEESRMPRPGEVAAVVLVDLATGQERVVAETRGWDTQLGAQVQWGGDDSQLLFNDMDVDTWAPYGVRMDPFTGERVSLQGTIYMATLDGRWALSPCLRRTRMTQEGYGAVVPWEAIPRNVGAPDDDGVYVTDTATGRCQLLVSIAQILREARPAIDPHLQERGDFYCFHVKWTPRGDRIMLVLRWIAHEPPWERPRSDLAYVITTRADGSDTHVAISGEQWSKGGHHPNWCPDGRDLMINLKLEEPTLWLVRARYDGAGLACMSDMVPGSGHPSLHPNGRQVVTDAYLGERIAYGDGTVPIRLIDLETAEDRILVRVRTELGYMGTRNQLRVDPHPAWGRAFRRIAFNACPDGTRRVYVADLSQALR